jgi:hypothetical protein
LNYGALVGYSDDDMAPDSISMGGGDQQNQSGNQQGNNILGNITLVPQQQQNSAASPVSASASAGGQGVTSRSVDDSDGARDEDVKESRGYWFLSGRHSGNIYLKAGTAGQSILFIYILKIYEGLAERITGTVQPRGGGQCPFKICKT